MYREVEGDGRREDKEMKTVERDNDLLIYFISIFSQGVRGQGSGRKQGDRAERERWG